MTKRKREAMAQITSGCLMSARAVITKEAIEYASLDPVELAMDRMIESGLHLMLERHIDRSPQPNGNVEIGMDVFVLTREQVEALVAL